jgi:MoxR-like ATPase
MLTHVPVVDQEQFKDMARFTIRHGGNLLIIGPSGGGKTEIINSVCEEENVNVQYINLAVLERTDFQGFPVISDNKKQVQYATPRYIPFIDSKLLEEKQILQNAIDLLSATDSSKTVNPLKERIAQIELQEKAVYVSENINVIKQSNPSLVSKLNKLVNSIIEENVDNKPFVFLFDEADKAPAETSNVLLEILQFHSVNGRKINLRACFLTGNLPDEYANSGSISHAISKRCRTVQLNVNWKIWREWAFSSKVHPNIISFITSHPEWLYKKAPDGDPTAYALPSPRTWTLASDAIKSLEKDNNMNKYSDMSMLMDKLIAANVGEGASSEFKVWLEHYQELDPVVEDIFEKGVYPKKGVLSAQQVLIAAISACNKVYAELKNDKADREKVVRHVKNVYKWLATLPIDVQHGSVRLSFGGDSEIVSKWELAEIDEFYSIFDSLKKTLSSWKTNSSN